MDKPIISFSALQRAENSSILVRWTEARLRYRVSVLFSEPKIPQWDGSPMSLTHPEQFQCSSASRKFLNAPCARLRSCTASRFSALQRAENSSILPYVSLGCGFATFQCSSASRKFLNGNARQRGRPVPAFQCSSASRKFLNRCGCSRQNQTARFSALQRAENSSMAGKQQRIATRTMFQCSSASRKFLNSGLPRARVYPGRFQCSSASRKFLNGTLH